MFKKKVIPLLIIIALVIGISGCNLVQVDPERDMQRTVFKTKEGKVEKKEFVNYMTYYEMIYKLNGSQMPVDEELTTLKEDMLNSLVEIHILKQEAVNGKYEVDTSTVNEELESSITQIKEGFESEDAYNKFIEERNLTTEEFESFLKGYLEDIKYANVFIENYSKELQENGEEANKTVVTVDGDKLLKDEFYYKLSQIELFYYANYGQGLPTDEEQLKEIYGQIQDEMAQANLVQKDSKNQGITLTEEDITKKQEDLKSQQQELVKSIYGEDQFSEYIKSLYITEKRYEELTKLEAQTQLYEEALNKNFEKDTTITEKEVKEYYETNKSSYDTSTVSAKHILTESEDLANEISKEITDAKSFEAAFEKYQDNEEVKEASDLGEFKFADMVTEFSTAAFGLDKGGVSKPVKSEHGYHIIYVYDKDIKEVPTLEDKTKEIKDLLMSQKVSTKLSDYKTDLVSKAKITKEEIKDPFEIFIEDLKEEYNVKTYPKRLE